MRVLYFTNGVVPTADELQAINNIASRGVIVMVRNRTNVGTITESFDAVSGTPPTSLMDTKYVSEFDNNFVASRYAAMLGDSRFGLSNYIGGNGAVLYKSMGLISWLQSASYGVLSIPETLNFGVAGENTQQILARAPAAIAAAKAAGANVMWYIGGTNDYTGGITDEQRKANVLATLDLIVKGGLMPLVICETPRRSADEPSYIERHWIYRQWLKGYLPTLGYKVIDVWPFLSDPTNPKVMPPNSTYDNQHGNPTQQQIMGLGAWRQAASVFGSKSILPISNDVYNATTKPNGSLVRNPLMTGTGGSKTANANATGQVADNWTVEAENFGGLKTECSLVPHPVAGYIQIIRIYGKSTATGDNLPSLKFYQDPINAPADGDKMKAVCELQWYSKYDNLLQASLNQLSFPKYFLKMDGDRYSNAVLLPKIQPQGRSRETPVLTKDSNTTSYRVYTEFTFLSGQDVDATFRISRMPVYKMG